MSIATSPPEIPVKPQTQRGSHHQRLARLRDGERQRRLTIAAVSAISMVMLLAGLLAVLDFYFEVATLTRLIAWAAIGVVVVGLVAALRQWRTYDSSDAVCEAERAWPDLGQRLRTSHDYQTTPEQVSPANPELIGALEAETQQQVSTHVIRAAWPTMADLCTPRIVRLDGHRLVVCAVAWPDWRVASARLMFVPVHYSDVQMEQLPEHVALGDDLVVRLRVEGRPLKSARVLYRGAGGAEWNKSVYSLSHRGCIDQRLERRRAATAAATWRFKSKRAHCSGVQACCRPLAACS